MTSRDCSSARFCWWSAALLLWGTAMTLSSNYTADENLQAKQTNSTNRSIIAEDRIAANESRHEDDQKDFCSNMTRMDCLHYHIHVICYQPFKFTMEHHDADRCVWSNVMSVYNNFTICTEGLANSFVIPWPNPMVEQTFLEIHALYFHDCPTEELSDPPPGIVLALVMTPICLIPVMVVLVVLKTKNGDGSS